MTDKKKILAFEKKLEQLKEEESRILKLLKDVRKQLKKYEVEELQTCNDSIVNKNDEDNDDEDSDDSSKGNSEMLLRIIDCARTVNSTSLDLGIDRILGEENNEDSEEESDESD